CVLRWRILMRPLMPSPTLARLCGIYCIGMFFNLTFPTIIGGDIVKVYYAGKTSRSYTESFASIFLDRDIGMFAMMIIACCAVLFHPVSVPGVPVSLILWCVLIVFVLGNIAVFTPRFHRLLARIFYGDPAAAAQSDSLAARLEKITAKIDTIAKAFRITGGRPAALWMSLGISFVNQILGCTAAWIIALSLDIKISPVYFLIFVPIITLISMIPISLNGMGLREYSFMSLFGAIGVAGESCIALGLLYSFMVILSSLPGGVVYIFFRSKSDGIGAGMAAVENELK
ncbi:MAG: flippase-like domain-containing protein, partial [Acidobacteria bacterium]|nr:flippase-like domain-containing protein [Acidobacteriota bacterium]